MAYLLRRLMPSSFKTKLNTIPHLSNAMRVLCVVILYCQAIDVITYDPASSIFPTNRGPGNGAD